MHGTGRGNIIILWERIRRKLTDRLLWATNDLQWVVLDGTTLIRKMIVHP